MCRDLPARGNWPCLAPCPRDHSAGTAGAGSRTPTQLKEAAPRPLARAGGHGLLPWPLPDVQRAMSRCCQRNRVSATWNVHTASAASAGPQRALNRFARRFAGGNYRNALPSAHWAAEGGPAVGPAGTAGGSIWFWKRGTQILFRKYLRSHHWRITSMVNATCYRSADTRKYGNIGFSIKFPFWYFFISMFKCRQNYFLIL